MVFWWCFVVSEIKRFYVKKYPLFCDVNFLEIRNAEQGVWLGISGGLVLGLGLRREIALN